MTHKVIIDREMLVSKLQKAITFVPKKKIIPQWDNFLLDVVGNTMMIVASDASINIKLFCPVQSKSDFTICVPAGLLFKTISAFKENEVTITVKTEKKIELKSGKSKYNISMDCFPEDYGMIKIENVVNEITLNQFMLRNAMKVAKSFIDDGPVENFSALNINEVDNKIVFTGLKRILMCRAAIKPISIQQWASISIMVDTAKKVINLLGDKGEIGIAHSGNMIKFFTDKDSPDHFEVISTTSNVKFPNTERLFAEMPTPNITINTLELRDAVKRLALYTPEGVDAQVKISNEENSQETKLVSSNVDCGHDGEELVSIMNPEALQFKRAWHSKSVMQILGEIEQAESFIHFTPGDLKGNSFFIPKTNTEEDNIYSFVIAARIGG